MWRKYSLRCASFAGTNAGCTCARCICPRSAWAAAFSGFPGCLPSSQQPEQQHAPWHGASACRCDTHQRKALQEARSYEATCIVDSDRGMLCAEHAGKHGARCRDLCRDGSRPAAGSLHSAAGPSFCPACPISPAQYPEHANKGIPGARSVSVLAAAPVKASDSATAAPTHAAGKDNFHGGMVI